MSPVYRLVVRLDGRHVVYDAPLFRHFKEARTHVAIAICRHACDGPVQHVLLQSTTPPSHDAPTIAHGDSPDVLTPHTNGWKTVTYWDSDVVQRILAQNGLAAPPVAPPVPTPKPQLASAAPPAPQQPKPKPRPQAVAAPAPPQPKPNPRPPAAAPPAPRPVARPPVELAQKPKPTRPAAAPARPPAQPAGRPTHARGRNGTTVKRALPPRPAPAPAAPQVQPTSRPRPTPSKLQTLPKGRPRSYGWQLVTTVFIMLVAWIGLTLLLTGGDPGQVLTHPVAPAKSVATKLPFRAP